MSLIFRHSFWSIISLMFESTVVQPFTNRTFNVASLVLDDAVVVAAATASHHRYIVVGCPCHSQNHQGGDECDNHKGQGWHIPLDEASPDASQGNGHDPSLGRLHPGGSQPSIIRGIDSLVGTRHKRGGKPRHDKGKGGHGYGRCFLYQTDTFSRGCMRGLANGGKYQ